jgi:hypothetical protein
MNFYNKFSPVNCMHFIKCRLNILLLTVIQVAAEDS